tara:strand:- start:68 stop:832 length:765 start_codon:yes stop_codon:yes gene_type:complete
MFRPRIIPMLLLKDKGIVKSKKFKNHKYIGDPINAVKIFNDLKTDELIFLDILATAEKRTVLIDFIKDIGNEANMPFSVGGGIRTINNIREIISAGAEKVVINTYAIENPGFIKEASEIFGSSAIVVCIDVKNNIFGNKKVYTNAGTYKTKLNPIEFSKLMEKNGAGEIIINSIDNDGMMEGYDLSLIKTISKNVKIPVVAAGGAGNIKDFQKAINESFASAVAAGSLFVYYGSNQAVLLNYPNDNEILEIFKS